MLRAHSRGARAPAQEVTRALLAARAAGASEAAGRRGSNPARQGRLGSRPAQWAVGTAVEGADGTLPEEGVGLQLLRPGTRPTGPFPRRSGILGAVREAA